MPHFQGYREFAQAILFPAVALVPFYAHDLFVFAF